MVMCKRCVIHHQVAAVQLLSRYGAEVPLGVEKNSGMTRSTLFQRDERLNHQGCRRAWLGSLPARATQAVLVGKRSTPSHTATTSFHAATKITTKRPLDLRPN